MEGLGSLPSVRSGQDSACSPNMCQCSGDNNFHSKGLLASDKNGFQMGMRSHTACVLFSDLPKALMVITHLTLRGGNPYLLLGECRAWAFIHILCYIAIIIIIVNNGSSIYCPVILPFNFQEHALDILIDETEIHISLFFHFYLDFNQ